MDEQGDELLEQQEARDKQVDKFRARPVTARRLIKAIRAVVEYVGPDEEEDFFNHEDDCSVEHHIYGSIIVLQKFLDVR